MSKVSFWAEARIYAAMEQEGLQAKVYRLGRLVGRASDGVFQRNPETNAFYLMLRAGQPWEHSPLPGQPAH